MEYITTIDDEGFLTIPDELLECVGWKVGDEIEIVLLDNRNIHLTKSTGKES